MTIVELRVKFDEPNIIGVLKTRRISRPVYGIGLTNT